MSIPHDAVLFWGKQHPEWRDLSNFRGGPLLIKHPLTGEMSEYPTVEHYFQACKTLDLSEHERVRAAPTAAQAKKLGRKVTLRSDWEEVKFSVMLEALRAKYSLAHYKQVLLSTGERPIFEDSPYDAVWGVGRNKQGKNLLGEALMIVRSELSRDL